ncbi:class I SAM-dependent methyltransferase [Pseudomonas sp. Marseille-Q5115]|uniref:class I SAM-dependent methyltransferase n=1 Tax=Pseudomonas sp. Marseille-Q5115 TaxID=2866593 RepID=UPI001CE3D081|nr:class I SAM-dependent methyltransferase [Pseudomonas sp. Marseille-Q5115]
MNIDEGARETGLRAVRNINFDILLTKIKNIVPPGKRVLDVGCAHGWFLERAAKDYEVTGVEPDSAVFQKTVKKGLDVRNGYFPDAMVDSEKYDAIVFNDVIEHIPDIRKILDACAGYLNAEGCLVLNLPNSKGVFYTVSKTLARLGVVSFFNRMWQKGLPSPHVHYFDSNNLIKLVNDHGFEEVYKGTLPALTFSGLYTRISYAGNQSFIAKMLMYVLIVAGLPFLKIMPSDIMYVIFRKK